MGETVETGGLEIAYERVGAGPLLVLVHGAAEDGRTWQRRFAVLADEFTVVAWDEPGAGRSCDLPEGMTLAAFADGLAQVHWSSRCSSGPPTSQACPGAAPSRWSCTAAIPGSSRP